MPKIITDRNKKKIGSLKSTTSSLTVDSHLVQLAFNNSLNANIITTAGDGKIIMANSAACKLLGYSEKAILTQSRSTIFAINENRFKKMLKQRTAEGQSKALVTAIKKSGNTIPCEITSAVFMDQDGIEKAITSITDISQRLSIQNKIDTKKEKKVANNITVAKIKADALLAQNNEWIKHIASTSYDVMWDWEIASGKIYAGDSVKEVFGYTLQNNMIRFKDFTACLITKDKKKFQHKLNKTLTAGHKSWNDTFMFMRQDGSLAVVESRASIVRDEHGKAIRLIGATQDISRLQELETKIREKLMSAHNEDREQFLLAAKISFDVIWDRNLLTNEVLRGEGFEEMLGYPVKEYKGNVSDWSEHIHPDDKEEVENGLQKAIASSATHWEHIFRIIRADGSIAKVFDRASIFRQTDGTAYRMIGAMQDISRQKELEEKLDEEIANKGKLLTEYKESFKLIFNSSSDILYDIDLVTNKIVLSDAYETEFGYKIIDNVFSVEDWANRIHEDDKKAVIEDYMEMLTTEKTEWKYNYRYIKADSSITTVISSAIVLRNIEGKAYRMIGSMLDINKHTVIEERLELEIKIKERQMAEALEEAREAERSEIGKELHDNVNQLLGASRLYLEMAKRGDNNSEMYLSRSSEFTLTAIEEIRKLTKGLTTDTIKNIGLCEAIENIAGETMEVSPVKILFVSDHFIENRVNDRFKLNVFRIVQEQLNNILKHAKATNIKIVLTQNEQMIALSISDNGIGFDTTKPRKGIGLSNIRERASFYKAEIDFLSNLGAGCTLQITFPVNDILLAKN